MMERQKQFTILMADDDADDCLLATEALEESNLPNKLCFVEDGEALLDYLYRRGQYAHLDETSRPGLILLDLNMPRKDGREALKEIKADPTLCQIPIVILTTSRAEEDIYRTYELGASSFITKPVTFDGLVDVIETMAKYWFSIVQLPPTEYGG